MVPHRKFTSIERTSTPAFRESRATNRPDLVDEGSHDACEYARAAAGSHGASRQMPWIMLKEPAILSRLEAILALASLL